MVCSWMTQRRREKSRSGRRILQSETTNCTEEEGQTFLEESHSGDAVAHEGARALIGKILCVGVYWPDVYNDAADLTMKCKEF
uniref:Uncharacterized protein n=1 Tax=Lactuca sativa TaxID=4236 RepID=A0A9R1WUX5_LACSA|nr:hypothetical protein LSAT_V11C900490480 [Lactuca sativa]